MIKKFFKNLKLPFLLVFTFTLFIISCDGGLTIKSESEKTFLNGIIKFKDGKNNWPPADSLFALRVIAFKNPPDSNIIATILTGGAYFTEESLAMNIDSANFSIEIKDPPVNLVYIAAIIQTSATITEQKVVGIYSLNNNHTSSEIYIEKGKKYNIQINVDFENLPPMPF